MASTGVLCVALGALGAVVPGFPTTIFLLIAAWCFAKSCPWLEQKLMRNRFFGPFLKYVDRTEPMPLRAKVYALGTMWTFIVFSSALFVLGYVGAAWIAIPIVAAGVIGTVFIVRWDRGVRVALEP